jgi:hypothetical protein
MSKIDQTLPQTFGHNFKVVDEGVGWESLFTPQSMKRIVKSIHEN